MKAIYDHPLTERVPRPKFKRGQVVIYYYDQDRKPLVVLASIWNNFNHIYAFSNSPAIICEGDLRLSK